MRLFFVSTAILLATLAAPAFAQQSSREDFKEFCKALQGRFAGEVVWVADWPGFGKKGDKVTAYFEGRIVDNGHVLCGRWYAGTGSGTGTYYFDAGSKQIKVLWVNSGGAVGVATISRKGNQWIIEESGSLADGTKTKGISTLTITDNGNTHTYTGTGTVGDKKTDDQHDVYRRVGK